MYECNGPMLNSLLQRFRVSMPQRTRVVAEQALVTRTTSETRAYLRYEAAADVAYEPFAASVLSSYDISRCRTRRWNMRSGPIRISSAVTARARAKPSEIRGSLSVTFRWSRRHRPGGRSQARRRSATSALRHPIAQLAEAAGLSPERIGEVTVAATERRRTSSEATSACMLL